MIVCIRLLSWQHLATSIGMATLFLFLGLVILWVFNSIPKFQNMLARGTCCDSVLGNIS